MNYCGKKILFLIIALEIILPSSVFAQGMLSLSPSLGSYTVGESFSVLVNLNTGGEIVNAGTGQINFDNSKLQVVSLGYSQSVFSLWTENPSYSNAAGTVTFSGGVPSPGFSGASGGLLRITFRAKAVGQAPVNFLSGSILANDGQGTNIADGLRGALYNINAAEVQSKVNTKNEDTAPAININTGSPIDVPVITSWPKVLDAGSTLTIEGLGIPLTKISIIMEKGTEGSINEYTISGSDGKFKFTYEKAVKAGYYRIWTRNVSDSGASSGLSDPVTIEVTESTFIRLGGIALDYMTIIVTLLALVMFIVLLLILLWVFYRKSRRQQGLEISEAEEVLHKSFDTIRDGMSDYVTYLVKAKTSGAIKKRELETKADLKEELENIEQKIKKEIRDIKR